MSGLFRFKLIALTFLLAVLQGVSYSQVLDDLILDEPITADIIVNAYNSITLKPGFSVAEGIEFSTEILVEGNSTYTGTDDHIKNWTESKAFDIDGNVVGHSKSYFDLTGKPVQSQVANLTEGKAIISQTLYDAFGRPVVSTLPAALANVDLNYKTGFIANTYGEDYSYLDFDGTKLDNPVKVNQAIGNSLGWYYSNNNIYEDYVPVSAYPYTRVEYSKITGQARRSAMAGEHHRMGNEHDNEPMSFTMPASDQELTTVETAMGIDLETTGLIKSVSVDAMGKISVTYTNSDGNIIATCLGKDGTAIAKNHLIPYETGYVDVYLSNGNITLPPGNTYTITDLVSENVETQPLPAGFYRIKVNETLTSDLSFTFEIENSLYSLNVYDQVGRLKESYSPKAVAESDNTLKTTYTYNILGWLIETSSPDEGTTQYVYRKDGSIRFSQNEQQRDDFMMSFTNYDDAGRIIYTAETVFNSGVPFLDMDGDASFTPKTDYHASSTMYDIPDPNFNVTGYTQTFVAGNISKTWNDNSTTWYSYTYDGKIEWIVQDIINLGIVTIDYEYDFNGNVTRVIYQKDQLTEQFIHEYTYDADMRLAEVRTFDMSADCPKSGWLQAKYEYYAHGPLKRVEIAENLQGIDYVYNINGWLKSINDPSLNSTIDPGHDKESSNGFQLDLFGMSLDYYSGDYTREGTAIESKTGNNLYDGNISAQRWQTRTDESTMDAGLNNHWLSTYTYDNRNYLQKADFGKFNYATNSFTPLVSDLVNLTYDANGNILTLNRKATTNQTFDTFAYTYGNGNNQLSTLADAAAPISIGGNSYEGLEQGSHSFVYNKIGQMTARDNIGTGLVDYYQYDVYGKVTGIYKNADMTSRIVEYDYDEKGFRVKKTDYVQNTETWYVRDASGNILSIYTANNGGAIEQTELPVYGSGRIGTMYKTDYQFEYELTDHLGNVRATFSKDASDILQLNSYADYYPFGMKMAGRMSNAGAYRFGYQGQFAEDETEETGYNAFELRLWDSRIGRWVSPDPYGQYFSPYLGMGNNPINGVDPDGGKWWNQGIDKAGNIIFDDDKNDGNVFLLNEGANFDGTLQSLIANSVQLVDNWNWIGNEAQKQAYVMTQFKHADLKNWKYEMLVSDIDINKIGFDNNLDGFKINAMFKRGNMMYGKPRGTWGFTIGNSGIILGNVYNLRNSIEHEGVHGCQALKLLDIGGSVYLGKITKGFHELQAIYKQRQKATWMKVTMPYRKSVAGYEEKFDYNYYMMGGY